ncbi:MAG: protein translocase subunit SecF [Pseudomonadota bacterium]
MAITLRQFDFISTGRKLSVVSAVLVVISLGSLLFNSLEFGLDFTSGTLVEVGYSESVEVASVSAALEAAGFESAQVVAFGSDQEILIRMPVDESVSEVEMANQLEALGENVMTALQAASSSDVELRRLEFVGPRVGEELAESGGMGILVSLGMIMLYVAVRFQIKFAIASVVALMHDVILTVGVFSIFRLEFDLTVLAAVLAVIGYSVNDKIVVFDRVRENFRIMRKGTPSELINASLNQTLSRTTITAGTTLLVVIAMLVAGGDSIQGFATALCLGISIGTYSSIYIGTTVALMLKVSKEDLITPPKEGAADSMP